MTSSGKNGGVRLKVEGPNLPTSHNGCAIKRTDINFNHVISAMSYE